MSLIEQIFKNMESWSWSSSIVARKVSPGFCCRLPVDVTQHHACRIAYRHLSSHIIIMIIDQTKDEVPSPRQKSTTTGGTVTPHSLQTVPIV